MKHIDRISRASISIAVALIIILALPSVALAGERNDRVTDLVTSVDHGVSDRTATTLRCLRR